MVGILSIDFDFFIDISAEDRNRFFPDGSDDTPPDGIEAMWEERYALYPQLRNIGLIREYNYMKNFLLFLNIRDNHIHISDSHKNIMQLVVKIPKWQRIRLVNIDFHHDYYHYYRGGESCNCGNWLRRLLEKRPDTSVLWIKRKDSQTISLEGEVPFQHTTDISCISQEKFSYLFICRSPEWSPPHLKNKYDELVHWARLGARLDKSPVSIVK